MNELTINLHTASETPLYEQIYQHIKREIQEGRITSGEKLPSSRSLCKYLEVSRSTVELAYEQLISEGYVEAVPCKGYSRQNWKGCIVWMSFLLWWEQKKRQRKKSGNIILHRTESI